MDIERGLNATYNDGWIGLKSTPMTLFKSANCYENPEHGVVNLCVGVRIGLKAVSNVVTNRHADQQTKTYHIE